MIVQEYVGSTSKLPSLVGHVVEIDPNILVIDEDNPNFMDKKKIKRLSKVIQLKGFLVPLVVDTDGRIIDGHQRLKAAELANIKPTAVIVEATTEIDRKFMRQWLNKFRGQHDTEMDISELEYLFADEQGAVMLEEYMDMKDTDVDDMKKLLNTPTEEILSEEPVDKKRRIVLFFTNTDYKYYRKRFDELMEKLQVINEVDVVKKLIDDIV